MSANLRAYLIVLFICSVSLFILARVNNIEESNKYFRRWAISWLLVTSVAFVAHNYWIFVFVVAFVLSQAAPKNASARLAFYLFLLPALPFLNGIVPGIGGIRYFFIFSYPRLLAIILLLPLFLAAFRKDSPTSRADKFPSDKYAYLYFVLWFFLSFRQTTMSEAFGVTDGFRTGLYIFLDAFLPYFVLSRYLRTMADFRAIFFAIFSSTFTLAAVGLFEGGKHWLLYKMIGPTLGAVGTRMTDYRERAGLLRVSAVFFGPIVFGYALVIGLGALNFLRGYFTSLSFWTMSGIMFVTLIATVSRGPWVGFAALMFVFAITSRQAAKSLMIITFGTVFGFATLAILPGGENIMALLPFIGSGEGSETIAYREVLFENSLKVISENQFFGLADFKLTEEMEGMRQGQGIIDVVNTYLKIGMIHGLIGLSLFLGVFLSLMLNLRKAIRIARPMGDDYARLGQSLLAILAAIMVIIGTVSFIDYIPIYFWSVAGISAAYINMMNHFAKSKSSALATESSEETAPGHNKI